MHVFKTSKINQYFHIAQLCVSASEKPGTYSRIYSVLITDGLGVKKKKTANRICSRVLRLWPQL